MTTRSQPATGSFRSCEKAMTPIQPRVRPIAAETCLGCVDQKTLSRIAVSTPAHTIVSTGTAQPTESTRSPNGV